MGTNEIELYIKKRRQEKDRVLLAWNYIEELNAETAFSRSCYLEIQARISYELALIDISIRDHKRLLNNLKEE